LDGLFLNSQGFKDLIPKSHWDQALESFLDAFDVMPFDISFDSLKLFNRVEGFTVIDIDSK